MERFVALYLGTPEARSSWDKPSARSARPLE